MKYPRFIAPKYNKCHDYLLYCNDVLVSMLKYADKRKLSTISIDLRGDDEIRVMNDDDITGKEKNHWLIENGHKEEMFDLYFRHTLFSLIADMCHYLFESITCAGKMKIAVAYALLRKPLRDNLGYIEWLCADRDSIVSKLLYDPIDSLRLEKELAKKHIDIIMERYQKLNAFGDIFTFRYEKNDDSSLEKIWNRANHIVTTADYTRTPDGSLNFVFYDENSMNEYVNYYYIILPYIMTYTIILASIMLENIADLNSLTKSMNELVATVKFTDACNASNLNDVSKSLVDSQTSIVCPKCMRITPFEVKHVRRLIEDNWRCPSCGRRLRSETYMFDWENKKLSNFFKKINAQN